MQHIRRTRARRAVCLALIATAVALSGITASARAEERIRLEVGAVGSTVVETSSAGGGSSIDLTRSAQAQGGVWNGTAEASALSAGDGGVRVLMSGNRAALARATLDNRGRATYRLQPPDGVNFAGGKLIVTAQLSNGEIKGNASLRMRLDVKAWRLGWADEPTGGEERTLGPGPGSDDAALRAEVSLPTYLDSTRQVTVEAGLLLDAIANVSTTGGALEMAEARTRALITGFQVQNAAGAPLAGFKLTGPRSIPEIPPPPAGVGRAVEFYIAAFGHFFISANPAEIAALDANPAWNRTGESFVVNTTPAAGLAGVCRFFREFPQPSGPAKSSHFYALQGLGCDELRANPQGWQFEGIVFYMAPPDATGGCPATMVPVFRLYNNGASGASNHRYTTSEQVRADMLRDDWISEGAGERGVGMCAPQ